MIKIFFQYSWPIEKLSDAVTSVWVNTKSIKAISRPIKDSRKDITFCCVLFDDNEVLAVHMHDYELAELINKNQ